MDIPRLSVSTRRLVALGVLVLVVGLVGARHLHAASAPPLRVAPLAGGSIGGAALPRGGAGAATRARAAPGAVVDVEGAVRRPGLVRLPPGARVADAVARAGGVLRAADRSAVNLAAPVSDGQQVVVPRKGASPVGAHGSAPAGAGPGAGPVSLTTATAEQLDALPGVGPVTAQKIIDYRTAHGAFHSVDELDAIPGIGPARLHDLQGLVVP